MRAAAYLSASIIAVGIYLLIAAATAMAATWVVLGVVAIASTMAIGLMTSTSARRPAIS
jgi:hypothetical protein